MSTDFTDEHRLGREGSSRKGAKTLRTQRIKKGGATGGALVIEGYLHYGEREWGVLSADYTDEYGLGGREEWEKKE